MSGKHQEMANVLSIALVNSSTKARSLFGEQFDESTAFVLQNLWYENSNSSHIYMEFGTYSSTDELRSELSKYISDKSYEFDTADLVFGALTRICKCRSQFYRPCWRNFYKHYSFTTSEGSLLLVEIKKPKQDTESVTISRERLATLFSQYFSRLVNACAMM